MIFLIENLFNKFLKDNALWIALFFAVVIIVTLLTIFLSGKRSGIKSGNKSFASEDFLAALGGRENIISLYAKGSRLSLVLKENNLLVEEDLRKNGVMSIIKMSSKITLVVNGSAEELAKVIK